MHPHGKTTHPGQPLQQKETHGDRMLISLKGSEPSLQPGAKVGELKQCVASRERLEALHEVCRSRDCWLQPDWLAAHKIKRAGN